LKIFLRKVKDMMTHERKLTHELLAVIKSIDMGTTTVVEKVNLLTRADALFFELTKARQSNFNYIETWLKDNDRRNILTEIKSLQTNTGYDGYQKALALSTGKAYEGLQYGLKNIRNRRWEALVQFIGVLNPFRWCSKVYMSKYGGKTWIENVGLRFKSIALGPEFSRIRRELLTGQTKTGREFSDIIKKLGLPAALLDLGLEFTYSYVIMSLILGFLTFMSDFLGKMFSYVPVIHKWDIVRKNAAEFDSRFASLQTEKHDESFMGQLRAVGGGAIGLIADLFSYITDNLADWDRIIPTYYDDIFKKYHEFTREVQTLDTTNQENIQRVDSTAIALANTTRNYVENIQNGTVRNYVENIQNGTVPINTPSPTPTPQTSGDSTITATPDGFKKFLELKGETGTFKSADSIGTDSKGNDYYYDINDKTFQPLD